MTAKRRTSLWIVLGTFATVLSVAAAASIQMRKDHAIALEQVERESRSFVAVTGALVTGALDRTQVMLNRAARISPGAAVAADPALVNVVATDALGNVAWDKNGTPIEPRRLSDMTLLNKLAATPESVRFVSGTLTDNEFGKSPFVVAMRSDSIAGQFVFALIDPRYLTSLLESVQGSRSVGVILADAQTRRIASTGIDDSLYANAASAIPANVSTTPSLRYIADGGANYLTTARLLPGYDLRLVTVVRAADALSQWYQSLPLYSIMIFGPSLLGAALAWALLTQIEKTSRVDGVLRRTEERFELAVSGAKCGIWDWDIANRRLYWSGAMNGLLGRGKQPRIMSLDEAEELIHPDDRFVLSAIEGAVRSGADGYDRSFRAKHADGHWVWMRAKGQHYRTIRSEEGRLSGIVLDISDQKRADARVDAVERVLEAAFENAAEAFVLWDRDDQLIVCNKRFQEFYGIDGVRAGESRGAIFKRARSPGEGADTAAPLEMFDSSGNTGTIELQKAGSRWLLVSERRALEGGKIAVATDITALKAHEDELETSRNLLETQTRELSELAKRLESEKERAEEGSRAKSEFLANVSHELRTPLNAIIGFSDVMRNEMLGALPPRYAEYASDINRSGQHLLDLINDALSMARIESGKIELEFVAADPSQLVNDAIKTIKPKADEAGLQFRINTPDLPPVKADRRAIKQVLLNLLSNAIKFNSSDGFITVETRANASGVAIWIHDTGIGIEENDIPRVMRPFEKAETAGHQNNGGMGLGLPVSSALVELHGGKLVIESELAIGTSVTFTLPFAEESAARAA
ncbi:MAG: PAS domain S-box protein [Alphaproteobacteria bacterium]|nr:PAS domain S-box protein [Alphaproteobacteria bacterium]